MLERVRELPSLHFVKVILHVHPHTVMRVAIVLVIALEVVHEVFEEKLWVVPREVRDLVTPILCNSNQRIQVLNGLEKLFK